MNKFIKDKDNKIIGINIFSSLLIKGIGIMVSVYSMNAYLSYFKDLSFLGFWLTIVSIINWILLFDLGIGNGLRNYLTKLLVEKKEIEIKKYISSAYISLGMVSLLGLFFLVIVSNLVNWSSILNISSEKISNNILKTIMIISFFNIFIRFFLNLINSILYALQKTFIINLVSLITNITLLIYLMKSKNINDISALYNLAVVHLLVSNIPLLLSTILVFLTLLEKEKPNIFFFDKRVAKKILGLGGIFFIAQIEILLMNATNEFIINKNFGAIYVVEYQVYFKIFSIATMVYAIILQPIWSAITKYHSEKRKNKIFVYLKLLYLIALLGTISCFVVALFSDKIIYYWLNRTEVVLSIKIAIYFVLYVSSTMFMNASTCIANGFGKVEVQVIYLFLAIIIKFYFSMYILERWEDIVLMNAILQYGLAICQGYMNIKLINEIK